MCLEDSKLANAQIGLIVVCALQYSTQKTALFCVIETLPKKYYCNKHIAFCLWSISGLQKVLDNEELNNSILQTMRDFLKFFFTNILRFVL